MRLPLLLAALLLAGCATDPPSTTPTPAPTTQTGALPSTTPPVSSPAATPSPDASTTPPAEPAEPTPTPTGPTPVTATQPATPEPTPTSPTPEPTPASPTPEPTPEPTPAAQAVSIFQFTFRPGEVTVPAGTTVTWTNKDAAAHTATADGGAFDSGGLDTDQSFAFTFSQAGSFPYKCKFHPSMRGTITVT